VAGKALMHDFSTVIIQLLDMLTLCMLYSSNWDVNDFSTFFGYGCSPAACLPLPRGRVLRKPYEIKALAIEARSGQSDCDAVN
jgi:hypothetical protein